MLLIICFVPLIGTHFGDAYKIRVQCEVPLEPEHGRVIFRSLDYGSRLQYVCDKGYSLNTTEERTCLETGLWSEKEPACLKPYCNHPSAPLHGRMVIIGGKPKVGSIVVFECQVGYKLEGSPISKCLNSGEWQYQPPVCHKRQCETPANPEQGRVVYESLEIGSRLQYVCDEGHRLDATEERKCLENGQWSGKKPACLGMRCTPPPNPEHGRVIYESLERGSRLQYICDKGHSLDPVDERKCLESGTWSGKEPACLPNHCTNPNAPLHGRMDVTGSIVVFQCEEGYKLQGSNTSECLKTGNWTFEPPVCLRLDEWNASTEVTPRTTETRNVSVTDPCVDVNCGEHGTCQANGQEATCICNLGYTFDPINIAAGCRAVSGCSPLLLEEKSKVIIEPVKDIYRLGESIALSCPSGYTLNPDVEKIMCLNYGWTENSVPVCQ